MDPPGLLVPPPVEGRPTPGDRAKRGPEDIEVPRRVEALHSSRLRGGGEGDACVCARV